MEDLGAMTLNMTILGERRAAPERVVSFVSSLYGHSQRLSRRPCEQAPKHAHVLCLTEGFGRSELGVMMCSWGMGQTTLVTLKSKLVRLSRSKIGECDKTSTPMTVQMRWLKPKLLLPPTSRCYSRHP